MKKPALVILAAGMGSRYGGLKQMDPMDPMGHAIIDYSIYDAKRAGFGKVVFVIKKAIEKDFKETVGARVPEGMEVCYAYQEVDALPEGYNVPEGRVKPWGTAHAVLCAKPFINEPFAVINADDYYGVDGYKVMADFLTSHEEKDGKAPFAMVGYHLGNTVTENGYVSRGVCEVDDNHQLLSITERTHIEKREDHAEFTEDDGATWTSLPFDTLVSMNFFGFQPMIMDELEKGFPAFLDQAIKENPLKGEYFIPSVASDLLHEGKASLEVLVSKDQWYGVTYPEDKQSVIDALAALRENGTYKILKRIIDGDLKTVMNSSKEEAAKLKCSPHVGINEFYTDNREGGDEPTFISTKINDGGFISLIKELPEDESSRAMFDVDFFAKGTRMIEADEENDRPAKLIVSGAVFNYSGALLPVEFSVLDPAAINYFENCDISNSNPLFTRIKGKQISSVVKTKKEEQGAFGEPIVKEFTSMRKDWIITWAAAEPYEFPSEDFGVEDIQKAMQDRELHLAELKQRYLDRKEAKKNGANAFQSTPTASPAPGGFNF